MRPPGVAPRSAAHAALAALRYAEFEAGFLRLVTKLTNGTRLEIDETGTQLKMKPGFLSGGKVTHDCGSSRCARAAAARGDRLPRAVYAARVQVHRLVFGGHPSHGAVLQGSSVGTAPQPWLNPCHRRRRRRCL